jgi:hypothetical protein
MENKEMQNIPNVMPNQFEAFNGDIYIQKKFLEIRDRLNIYNVVETGTCLGGTAKWLAENFENVHTVELRQDYLDIAKEFCQGHGNIHFYQGDSAEIIYEICKKVNNNTIFFHDSHWYKDFPLKNELLAIKQHGLMPVITIHDFKVPGQNLGFDSYKGNDLSYQNFSKIFDQIYGCEDYYIKYNSEEESTEVKRGIIYVYPVIENLKK